MPISPSPLRIQLALVAALVVAACGGRGGGDAAGTGAAPAFGAERGVGALYGARDPRTCPDRKQPTSGAPSPAQATAYVVCAQEHEFSQNLYLVDQIEVTGVAKGRPYNPIEDRNMSDIDIEAPVHAIRGHYVKYQCDHINSAQLRSVGFPDNTGKNCRAYDQPQASGLCYKNTFGDWTCSMIDVDHNSIARSDVGPPA